MPTYEDGSFKKKKKQKEAATPPALQSKSTFFDADADTLVVIEDVREKRESRPDQEPCEEGAEEEKHTDDEYVDPEALCSAPTKAFCG